jgi:TPR repeat protein
LLARGDAFLGTGDITSARLFYERAADAESGLAALRLGATFDPVLSGRASLRGATADPAQALSWYRRARELGVSEAEQRIKGLDARSLGDPYTRPR